jgi:hypothetical protein
MEINADQKFHKRWLQNTNVIILINLIIKSFYLQKLFLKQGKLPTIVARYIKSTVRYLLII